MLTVTQQPNVELENSTLAYWPTVPVKVSESVCPGLPMVTAVGMPEVRFVPVSSLNTERLMLTLNYRTGQASTLDVALKTPRSGHTATLMPDGTVLPRQYDLRTRDIFHPTMSLEQSLRKASLSSLPAARIIRDVMRVT